MDIKLENNRWRTTSPYNDRILRTLNKLEGQKRWGSNRSFSFENTPYNLEIWRSVFPDAKIEKEVCAEAPRVIEGWLQATRLGRPTFRFKTPPRDHQKKALEKLATKPHCGLFMDVGTGKSWTAIALMGMRWCSGESDHVLLVAKNGVHNQWVEEALPQHMSDVVPWKAWVFGKTRKDDVKFQETLNFEGLKILAINIDAISTPKGEARILEFLNSSEGRATMIVDESQDIKNIQSNRTTFALRYRNLVKYAMIMTGTPIAKDIVDLFSQFKFLHPSILGHKYITTFKKHYCEMEMTDYGLKVVGHKNIEELYSRIEPYIFRVTSDEALKLDHPIYDERPFILSDEQKKAMKQLRDNFFADFGGDSQLFIKNAASLLTRMQQISCGYLPMEDGSLKTFPNPRLNALVDLLDQRSGKVAIWCRFNHDIELLSKELGAKSVTYYGKTTQQQRMTAKDRFLNDPDVIYFIASPEAAGTGLDGLQTVCWTNVYYSNSFNSLARWQSEGRTRRDGTTTAVTYFDLIAKGSPDRKILANLRSKKSVSDLTLDEYRQMLSFEEP